MNRDAVKKQHSKWIDRGIISNKLVKTETMKKETVTEKMTKKDTKNNDSFIKLLKQLDVLMKQNDSISPEACRQGHRILNTSAVRVVKENQVVELEACTVYQSMGALELAEKFTFSAEEEEVLEEINKIAHSGNLHTLGFYPRVRLY